MEMEIEIEIDEEIRSNVLHTYIHTYITILSGPVASFPLPNLNIYQPMQQKIPYGALPIGQILFTNKLLHQSYTNYGFRISTYHSTD